MQQAKNTLSDSVHSKLEKLILSMNPGDRLPTEKELGERFEVGRSTIRECMAIFVARKMVIRRNEGTFVADSTKDFLLDPLNLIIDLEIGDLNDLMELRELLEMNTIRLAALRATDEDIQKLEHLDWMMREPGLARSESDKRDIEFHRAIASSTGNTVLAELVSALRTVIAQNTQSTSPVPQEWIRKSLHLRQEMIDSIRCHDADAAYRCMETYFEEIHHDRISPPVQN